MKLGPEGVEAGEDGRAPRGARGLKLSTPRMTIRGARSRPARGAWIETST